MKIKELPYIFLGSLFISCSSGTGNEEARDFSFSGDTVTIKASSPILGSLKTATIQEEPFSSEFRTVGSVQAETDKYAQVSVPFDGRITRNLVHLGDKVSAGASLFEMSSADFLEASKTYMQAIRSHERAQADYLRKKGLKEDGITSERELEEAYTEAENTRQEMASAEATLRIFSADPSSLSVGQALRITAPISGEVVQSSVTPGQFVKADGDPLITIADLSKVWVTALVKERNIGAVQEGSMAEVFTEAEPGKAIMGKVLFVGSLVDEQTRSVQVILGCDNPDRTLKHGMFVSVHFMSEAKASIVLPSTAIFQGERGDYVYVATPIEGTYVRRDIETGSSSDDNQRVSIIKGIGLGERVLTEGGIYLND